MDSELMHTADEPVRAAGAWQWADTSRDAYLNSIAPLVGISSRDFLAEDDALVTRMQFWLDRFDGWLRTQSPQDMRFVPAPKAQVLKEPSVNAFVAPLPVCYDVGMKWSARGTETDAVFVDAKTGELSLWPTDELKCEKSTDAQRLADALQSLSQDWQGCKISKAGTQYAPQNCDVASDLAGKGSARKIVLFGMSNRITVHTALIGLMDEQSVAAVLAHELTHYYRAHGVAAEKYYDYFYRLAAANPTTKPAADQSLAAQGKKAVASSVLLNSTDMHEQGGATQFRSELYSVLGSVIQSATTPECEAAKRWLAEPFGSDDSAEAAMGQFPYAKLSDSGVDAYRKFLELGEICAKTIEVAAGEGFTGKKIGWRSIRNVMLKPAFPKWQGQIRNQAALKRIRSQTVDRFNSLGQNPIGTNLWDSLTQISKRFGDQDTAAIRDLQKALDDRLGQYTAEQEADDMSLEILADTGLEPAAGINAMRALGRGETSQLSGFLFGEDECANHMSSRWRAPNGDTILVPIGDFSEVHHSTCFRMWNMEREIVAHDWRKSSMPLTLPTARWSDLQTSASRYSDEVARRAQQPEKPLPNAVSAAALRAAGGDCVYGSRK
jgi:hypothetical protein